MVEAEHELDDWIEVRMTVRVGLVLGGGGVVGLAYHAAALAAIRRAQARC